MAQPLNLAGSSVIPGVSSGTLSLSVPASLQGARIAASPNGVLLLGQAALGFIIQQPVEASEIIRPFGYIIRKLSMSSTGAVTVSGVDMVKADGSVVVMSQDSASGVTSFDYELHGTIPADAAIRMNFANAGGGPVTVSADAEGELSASVTSGSLAA